MGNVAALRALGQGGEAPGRLQPVLLELSPLLVLCLMCLFPFLPLQSPLLRTRPWTTRRGLPPSLATLGEGAAVRKVQASLCRCQTRHQGALRTLRLRHALGAPSPLIPTRPALSPLQG